MRRRARELETAAALAVLIIGGSTIPASADCPGGGFGPTIPLDPNVGWVSSTDELTACPAGDSVLAGHPWRFEGTIFYGDECNQPRVGVPPESIWVTVTILSGNIKVNDKSTKIFADDSTDAQGRTRITIPSFSGCGRLRLNLFVSGVSQDPRNVTARTTDSNADGRVDMDDTMMLNYCDLDYDGDRDISDQLLVAQELTHWHRHVLHGTLVARTSLCDNCPLLAANTLGESDISWSPDDVNLSFTIFVQRDSAGQSSDDCHVFYVPSDPKNGNTPTHFSFPPFGIHDYDPSWSPVGDQIAFDREDNRIIRKGIPGVSSDTTEKIVAAGDVGLEHRGAIAPAISPDAKWIVFSLKDQSGVTGNTDLWIVSLDDTSQKKRLTTNLNAWFPQWSPDGQWVLFDEIPDAVHHRARRVRPFLDPVPPPEDLLMVPDSLHAATPASSPDSLVVVLGRGQVDITAHTIDPLLGPAQTAVENFPDHRVTSGVTVMTLASRMSSDGTRVALRARRPGLPSTSRPQLWAARRNMSLPPVFDPPLPGGLVVVPEGENYQLTVSAVDPENDPITYSAFFLQLGMTFDPATRVFSWTPPPGSRPKIYHVKFLATTPSGGSDSHVLRIKVTAPGTAPQAARQRTPEQSGLANPSLQGFALYTPVIRGEMAVLEVFDVSGRRVARVVGPSGSRLMWDGNDRIGTRVAPGVYLYRLRVGTGTQSGKWVLVR